MTRRDNPNSSDLPALLRRIEALESARPLESSSVTNGRVRFIGGTLRVDSGGSVEIVGTLEIDGTTTVNGTFNVDGPWNLAGDGTISGNVTGTGTFTWNGPWNLAGSGDITGDVDITGILNLLSELRVDGAGKITLGNMVLDPSVNGGSIKFLSGPEVYAAGGELSLYSAAAFITLDAGSAKLSGPGAKWLEITSSAIRAVGLPTKTAASTGLPAGVVHADSSGNLFRIV